MNRRELIGGLGAALALGLPQRVWAEPAPRQSWYSQLHPVLIMDGVPDSSGEVFDPAGITDNGNLQMVPVLYDYKEDQMMGWAQLKFAKMRHATILFAKFKIIPQFKDVAPLLYPCVGGSVTEKEGNVLKKVIIRNIGLCPSRNHDRRILRLNGLP